MSRKEAVFLALLLAGSVAAVVFIFAMMSRPGGAFAPSDEKPARRPPPAAPVDEGGPDPAARKPAPPRTEPKPEPEAPAADEAEEAGDDAEKESDDDERPLDPGLVLGELTLDLLAPADAEDRQVRVTVMDREGTAMPGVLVVFREGETLLYRERADEQGVAVFAPYENEGGPFRVDALEHGFVPATAAKVAPGASIDLYLVMRPSITGIVRAPSQGHGLVRVFTETREYETKIGNDGSFLFEDLEPGPVTVQAIVPPYGATSQSFVLREGVQERLLLRVRQTSRKTILGEIDGWNGHGKALINGVPVPVMLGGTFKFKDAVVGQNEIYVDAEGRALFRERFDVVAGRTTYKFHLPREETIRGTVRSARTKSPVPGAQVRVGVNFDLPENREANPLFPIERVPVVYADRDGRYEIPRLDGRLIYLVSVVADGFGQYLDQAVPRNKKNVEMPEGPYLFGKLRGLGGVPRGAVVTARPLEAGFTAGLAVGASTSKEPDIRFNVPAWDHSRSLRDNKGFYGLTGLLPGLYLMRVDAAGYGSMETVVDMGDLRRARLDVRLRRGQFADDDEAELLQRLPPTIYSPDPEDAAPADTTILRIDISRPLDQPPLPGARVLFFEGDQEFAPPLRFDRQQFELVGLPEATYRAVLTHPTLKKPIVKDITLRRGEPVDAAMK